MQTLDEVILWGCTGMIFVGDIAVPFEVDGQLLTAPRFGEPVFANLEGALAQGSRGDLHAPRLFNHPTVTEYLRALNVLGVTLANNHILDVAAPPAGTIEALEQSGIAAVGVGDCLEDAARPLVVQVEGEQWVLVAFGWEPIGCVPAGTDRPGVNPLEPRHVLESVRRVRRKYPDGTLVLLPHWGYELELYPLPMHRQLAFAAVEAGADAVIGAHSHCVQGIEVYRGAPIVYGLGNWLLVQGYYFDGKLRFPDLARLQLAFEWRPEADVLACHWFDYDPDTHQLERLGLEQLDQSERIRTLTPFAGMHHREYTRWFRGNRRKRRGLPVYVDYTDAFCNQIRDRWVHFRQALIAGAVALGIKGSPR